MFLSVVQHGRNVKERGRIVPILDVHLGEELDRQNRQRVRLQRHLARPDELLGPFVAVQSLEQTFVVEQVGACDVAALLQLPLGFDQQILEAFDEDLVVFFGRGLVVFDKVHDLLPKCGPLAVFLGRLVQD